MFFPNSVIAEIERKVRVFYISQSLCRGWNEHRRGDELRLLTGWTWQERAGTRSRTGFKTQSAAMRDAYYVLIQGREQPADVRRPGRIKVAKAPKEDSTPLRLVAGGRA